MVDKDGTADGIPFALDGGVPLPGLGLGKTIATGTSMTCLALYSKVGLDVFRGYSATE